MYTHIAWVISPHGFGHAARAAAVMAAIYDHHPPVRFEIFTSVPEFFFNQSLPAGCFSYHYLLTDIGLAQQSALVADLPETIRRLNELLPFNSDNITGLATELKDLKCRLVVCDIAPMGIAAAKTAAVPSVLIENFTWDWIYGEYSDNYPAINPHIDYLCQLFAAADFHIRAEPAHPQGHPHLTTTPISRKPVTDAQTTRDRLNIPGSAGMVTITMGGVGEGMPFIGRLSRYKGVWFVIAGSSSCSCEGNVIRLTGDSDFYHPDLVNASDVVIGKPGYSTVAEIFQAGVPFGYVLRKNFRESKILETFIRREMSGIPISDSEFSAGVWLDRLPRLLSLPRIRRTGARGAAQAARFILSRMNFR